MNSTMICNRMKSIISIGLAVFTAVFWSHVSASYLQTQYQPASLSFAPYDDATEWKGAVFAQVAWGDSRKARHGHESKSQLLDNVGVMDITRLGRGMHDRATVTETYWKTNKQGTLDGIFSGNDGKISVSGKFDTTNVFLGWRQNLCWGLFAQLLVPLRDLRIKNIEFKNLGSAIIHGKDSAGGNAIGSADVNVKMFMDDVLDVILKENGFTQFKTEYKKSGIADVMLSCGWSGRMCVDHELVSAVGGELALEGLAPSAHRRNEGHVFSIPLGYNGFWGTGMRGNGYVVIWDRVWLMATTGVMTFFKEEQTTRVASDPEKKQAGWLRLQRASVRADQGSIWDVGGACKVDVYAGFFALAGYSFTRKEATTYDVEDDEFLKTEVAANLANPNPSLISKNDVASTDPRLEPWERQTLHVSVGYRPTCFQDSWIVPCISLQYDYPITGRRIFATDMLGGTAQLECTFSF